jgi:hypothetical protein
VPRLGKRQELASRREAGAEDPRFGACWHGYHHALGARAARNCRAGRLDTARASTGNPVVALLRLDGRIVDHLAPLAELALNEIRQLQDHRQPADQGEAGQRWLRGVLELARGRLVARAGFKAGFITGAGVSEASLGWADFGVMSYEENLRVCRALVGCAVVIYPRLLAAAAIQGMNNAMAAFQQMLATGKVVDRPDLLVSFEDLNELVGIAELQHLERRHGS